MEENVNVNVDQEQVKESVAPESKVGADGKVQTPEQIAASEKAVADKAMAEKATADKMAADQKAAQELAAKKAEGQAIKNSPDKYEFKLPEEVKIDPALLETVTGVFKELDLSQEQAQKLMDLETSSMQAREQEAQKQFEDLKNTWKEETKKLYGADFDKKFQFAGRAMDVLGTPELRQVLADSGLEFHPDMVKLFIKAGESLSPDKFPSGTKGVGMEGSTGASKIYPSQNNK